MKGRKPTPTSLKRLTGNPGHRPLPEHEPQPTYSDKVPRPPRYLKGQARAFWFKVAPQLHAVGLLSNLDVPAFSGACVQYGRWRDAEDEITKTGAVVRHPRGFPMYSPFLRVSREAFELWTKLMSEFGLTPSSRNRVHVEPQTPARDPFEDYLEGRTGLPGARDSDDDDDRLN